MDAAHTPATGDAPQREAFQDVQRIVLVGDDWALAQHLVLHFPDEAAPRHFLDRLLKLLPVTPALPWMRPRVQMSLGLSRHGLERMDVPSHVLTCFAAKAPAFMAGAALRSASALGHSGDDAPLAWDEAFGFEHLDGVISLHARHQPDLVAAVAKIQALADEVKVSVDLAALPLATRLQAEHGGPAVHFGYRDGLSKIGIEGWSRDLKLYAAVSQHAAGEFVLGHVQNSGANPWMATAGLRVWPEALRGFFRNGSFGVLHQLEQHVAAFEAFVAAAAEQGPRPPYTASADDWEAREAWIKAKQEAIKAWLCGRTVEGRPLAIGASADPKADFDYTNDPDGLGCPFGSHVRRMNPRGGPVAHKQPRPLLRRGLPYGEAWRKDLDEEQAAQPRGLMGHFFCASIEDQFEHLVGQWAERVPLGSPDPSRARDPFIGSHEPQDGAFVVPQAQGAPLRLKGLSRYTRTRGLAYLFYPSASTLAGIARSDLFLDRKGDDE